MTRLQVRVTRQILHDRLWPWRSLEILWWSVTNSENTFFSHQVSLRIRGFASKGLAKQHACISWRSFAQAFDPLLHPTERATNPVRQFRLGPLWMFLHELLEQCSIQRSKVLASDTLLSRTLLLLWSVSRFSNGTTSLQVYDLRKLMGSHGSKVIHPVSAYVG